MQSKASRILLLSGLLIISSASQMLGQGGSPSNPEQVRLDLLNFVQVNGELAASAGMTKQVEDIRNLEDQVRLLSTADLDVLRKAIPDTGALNAAARTMRRELDAQDEVFSSAVSGDLNTSSLAGFPNAEYPSCGSTRKPESTIDAADIVLFAAETVRDVASRGCGQVAVVAGFGANTSTLCIITDAVYLTAKIVNYALHFCDAKIDGAEASTAYGRLSHLHTDLESSVANDNTNKTSIINNDNFNKTAIIANDDANRTTIVNNDNANRTTIMNNDNANTANILANANANKNELRDLVLRTQIEADLAQPDNAVYVALFVTPTANGGYLNLVRSIVAQTIANMIAAGGKTGQAQSFLDQGDASKTEGNFKQAYANYRKAYKAAVN